MDLRISRRPLRQTLPAAISLLAAVVVLLAILAASREVRGSARMAAEERLTRVVDQLAELAANSAAQRNQTQLNVGRNRVLAAALRGDDVAASDILDAIAPLRTPSDSGLPIQLRDAGGRIVFTDMPDAVRSEIDYDPLIPFDSVPAYGAFHQFRGEMLYYSTTPVVDAGVRRGWVVQRRRIGNARTGADVEQLIGSDSRVLFSYDTDSVWVTLAGEPVAAPLAVPPHDTTVLVTDEAGARSLVRSGRIRGTPWNVVVAVPYARVLAGARTFMLRMTLYGALLVIGAAVAAWLLSRRMTRPLSALATASGAVAAGDYRHRVPVEGGEELARLALAFNEMAGQVATSHDTLRQRLDEEKSLTRALEAANVQAEQARAAAQRADRAKSDFLATMSHEIRTPINAVLGFCELLELDGTDERQRQEYLARTRRAARQLAALVEDVLDLARVDSGRMRVEPAAGAVRDVVDHVLALVDDTVRRKNIDVQVHVPLDHAFFADARRVEQILLNLLSNAVKFTPAGGRIGIASTALGAAANGARPGEPGRDGDVNGSRRIRIDVQDTGIGIDPAEHERIFEPFTQAQAGYTREYGGTGLGLTISRRLARLMDGDILVDSRAGDGAKFTLVLPGAGEADD